MDWQIFAQTDSQGLREKVFAFPKLEAPENLKFSSVGLFHAIFK